MKTSIPALSLLALVAAPAAVPAQDPEPARATLHHQGQRQSTGFVLEAGEHNIEDLIDQAAEFLGRNILSNAQELQILQQVGATVRLHKRIEVDALGCEELLSSLLYTKWLALVPVDADKGFWEVLSLQGPRRAEIANRALWRTPEEVLRRPNLKVAVLTAVPLEHINPMMAVNSLRPFFAATGAPQGTGLTIGSPATSNSILLLGFSDQVAAAIRLLREVDRPLAERDPDMQKLAQDLQAVQAQIQQLRAELRSLEQGKRRQ